MSTSVRLDRFLAEAGAGTRSEVKKLVKQKQVTVNGRLAVRPEQKICPESDEITCKGSVLRCEKFVYYLLHKPAGCVSATEDARERTVLSYLGEEVRRDLFPVGRLDKDTEGLLLLTNDGALAHRLLSPKKHVEKTYYAEVTGQMTEKMLPLFAKGLDIGDETPTLPAKLEILSSGETSRILLTITEGRFHQVKRMCRAAGCEVTYLKRLRMGPLLLDETLSPGEYRALTAKEKEALGV